MQSAGLQGGSHRPGPRGMGQVMLGPACKTGISPFIRSPFSARMVREFLCGDSSCRGTPSQLVGHDATVCEPLCNFRFFFLAASIVRAKGSIHSGPLPPPPAKYVVSSTLEQVDWNAELVRGDLEKAVQQLKRQPGNGLFVGGVKLPLALAELGLIDEYEFVVHPRIAGHGPTLFAGLSKPIDLKLVGRLELGSGAVAMRYEPRRPENSARGPPRRHHPAVLERWPPRRNHRRHRGGALGSEFDSATTSPARQPSLGTRRWSRASASHTCATRYARFSHRITACPTNCPA